MSTEILSDDFQNRGSGGPFTLGTPNGVGAYEAVPGRAEYNVLNQQMYHASASTSRAFRIQTNSPDHGLVMTYHTMSSTSWFYCVRWAGAAAASNPLNCYALLVQSGGGVGSSLYRYDSGGTLTMLSMQAFTIPEGAEVTTVVRGNVIYILLEGIVVRTITDPTPLPVTNTYTGLFGNHSTAAGVVSTRVRAFRIDLDVAVPWREDIGWRMPYHIDGTTYSNAISNGDTVGGTAQWKMDELNDEDSTPAVAQTNFTTQTNVWIQLNFPEPRVITSFFLAGSGGGLTNQPVGFSTLGLDGTTWTEQGTNLWTYLQSQAATGWRTTKYYMATNPGSVRGVRIWNSSNGNTSPVFTAFHLYGYIPQNAGVHRLRLWHPYINVPLPGDYFDLDDVGRGTLRSREFRIKNLSTVMTANNISVDVQSPTHGTTLTDQFGLRKASDGAGIYVPTATLGSIAPNSLSERFTFRRITASDQAYRIETPFVRVQTGSFS